MKKIVFITLAILALSASGSIAQTKFIAHRSHSGTDRLFNPDGAGNFGEMRHYYRELIEEDTLKNGDTSTNVSRSINGELNGEPSAGGPETKTVTPPTIQDRSQISQPKGEAEPENVLQPERPEILIEATDSVDKTVEPGLAVEGSLPSGISSADQVGKSDPSAERNVENTSGSLPWLALGLVIPAAMIVVIGLRRRERDLG